MIPIIISFVGTLTIMAYQPWQSEVIFNHTLHFTEQGIDCTTCHDVALSSSSSDKNIPEHDVCSQCHSVANAPEDCKVCHINPEEPTGVTWTPQELVFSHHTHLKTDATSKDCLACHKQVDKAAKRLTSANFPAMQDCFQCHNGVKASTACEICHSQPQEMKKLIHPPDWKHKHKFDANAKIKDCNLCHLAENFCSDCHADDNLTGFVHELNYRWNHGLDAKGKESQCQSCHDPETFCNPCHEQEQAMPLDHIQQGWTLPPFRHADAARRDIEACASCHSESPVVCARGGCHHEGTQRSIHDASIKDLGHGPWHDDDSFQCYQCHINTHRAGVGFCGYCHGTEME
jgi:hypothetical protein